MYIKNTPPKTRKPLNRFSNQGEALNLNSPVLHHIDTDVQKQTRYYIFEYELKNPDQKPNFFFREFLTKHVESFFLYSASAFLITNIKHVKKFINELANHQEEIQIVNYSLIAIEKGYIISNWLKQI